MAREDALLQKVNKEARYDVKSSNFSSRERQRMSARRGRVTFECGVSVPRQSALRQGEGAHKGPSVNLGRPLISPIVTRACRPLTLGGLHIGNGGSTTRTDRLVVILGPAAQM